jgi:hypothetical protein
MTMSHAHDHDQDHRDPIESAEDQLYLLTLCLELQFDLLLVALRPGGATAHLDLTGETPVVTSTPATVPTTQRRSWLAARYAAIADAVDEMLDNVEIRRHPAVVARLVEARATCEARLALLARHLPAQAATATPPAGLDLSGVPDDGLRVEAGHFLG